jgi:hypothetical protein
VVTIEDARRAQGQRRHLDRESKAGAAALGATTEKAKTARRIRETHSLAALDAKLVIVAKAPFAVEGILLKEKVPASPGVDEARRQLATSLTGRMPAPVRYP